MAYKTQLSQEAIDTILDGYCNKHYGLIKTGKLVNVGPNIVRRILLEHKVHIRSFAEAASANCVNRRQYNVNDDYFDQESPNMAYLLGFLAADGTVRKDSNEIKIGLSSVDADFLEMIRQELQIEHPLFTYETNNGYSVTELKFTSSKIKRQLAKYNIVPNKTYTFDFPTTLSSKYYIDFIRGYFDGDGSISTAGTAIRFQICSFRPNVLEAIVNILYDIYGIPKVNIQRNMKESGNYLYTIQYSTTPTRQIFNILYTPNSLYLSRKYEKYKSIV